MLIWSWDLAFLDQLSSSERCLSTANLPECAAAGHWGWSVWRAQVLRQPLWPVLWPRGRGTASDEDQQLPVLLIALSHRSISESITHQQASGKRYQLWLMARVPLLVLTAGQSQRVAFTAIFCLLCLLARQTSSCSKHVTCFFADHDYKLPRLMTLTADMKGGNMSTDRESIQSCTLS